jgi:hypothetical protein
METLFLTEINTLTVLLSRVSAVQFLLEESSR